MKQGECWFCRVNVAVCIDPLSPRDTFAVACQPCAMERLDRAIFYNRYLRDYYAKKG